MSFFIEVLLGGLLSGVMYALVAIGFRPDLQGLRRLQLRAGGDGVLRRPHASSASSINSACLCGWRFPLTIGGDDPAGLAIERVVLRPLVNQPEITLFMATIGLAFFIEGLAQLLWGIAGTQARPAASRTCRTST